MKNALEAKYALRIALTIADMMQECVKLPQNEGLSLRQISDSFDDCGGFDDLMEKATDLLDQLIDKPPVVKHVWFSDGRHGLEVNGTRGDSAMYEGIAMHPAGYVAITPYYEGVPLDGDETSVGGEGAVWRVERVTPEEFSVVTPEMHKLADDIQAKEREEANERIKAQPDNIYAGLTSWGWQEIFSAANRAYNRTVPYAYDKLPSYVAWRQSQKVSEKFDKIAYMNDDNSDDKSYVGRLAWEKACREQRGAVRFENQTLTETKQGVGPGDYISAWTSNNLHVGEYSAVNDSGTVFA